MPFFVVDCSPFSYPKSNPLKQHKTTHQNFPPKTNTESFWPPRLSEALSFDLKNGDIDSQVQRGRHTFKISLEHFTLCKLHLNLVPLFAPENILLICYMRYNSYSHLHWQPHGSHPMASVSCVAAYTSRQLHIICPKVLPVQWRDLHPPSLNNNHCCGKRHRWNKFSTGFGKGLKVTNLSSVTQSPQSHIKTLISPRLSSGSDSYNTAMARSTCSY